MLLAVLGLDLLKKGRWTASVLENWEAPAPEEQPEEYQRLVELIRSLPR